MCIMQPAWTRAFPQGLFRRLTCCFLNETCGRLSPMGLSEAPSKVRGEHPSLRKGCWFLCETHNETQQQYLQSLHFNSQVQRFSDFALHGSSICNQANKNLSHEANSILRNDFWDAMVVFGGFKTRTQFGKQYILCTNSDEYLRLVE